MNEAWRASNPWAIALAESRDARIALNPPVEPVSLTSLQIWILSELRKVAARDVNVSKLLQMTGPAHGQRTLLCGSRKDSWFVRKDGLRCNFKISVLERAGTLLLLSYSLNIMAPEHHHASPAFLRWEYEQKRKPGVDAVKEPLSHLHPGHDDVRVPSPALSPKELIAVFLGVELWH